MSYTCIFGSKNGKWTELRKVKNSWYWHMNIWLSLWEEYLKEKENSKSLLLNPYSENISKVWALASNQDVPEFERAVLNSTFDKTIIRRSSVDWLIKQIEEFEEKYPEKTSAKEMIACFKSIMADEELNKYENFLICTSTVLYEGRLKTTHSKCSHKKDDDSNFECEIYHDNNEKYGELLSLINGETFFEIRDATVNPDYEGVVVSGNFATI